MDVNTIVLLLEVAAIAVVPAAAACVWVSWRFVARYPRFRFPRVMAMVNTIAFPISVFIGYFALIRLQGITAEPWMFLGLSVSFIALDILIYLNTGYLVWLDRRLANRDDELRP